MLAAMAISWDGSPLLIPHDIGELKWKERVWKVHLEFKVAKIPAEKQVFQSLQSFKEL